MAIPMGYSRSTIYGHLPGGEIFNFSLWANEAPADQAATQAQATNFATDFQSLIDTPGASDYPLTKLMGSDSGYDGVRVYSYNSAGGKAQFIADAPITRPGSQTSGAPLPNQCAIVCTVKTANAGRRNTGRVYLPFSYGTLGSGGQMSTSMVNGCANFLVHLIQKWNAHLASQRIGVLSQTAGTFNAATVVKVDSKVDIQRRRANHAGASYIFSLTI